MKKKVCNEYVVNCSLLGGAYLIRGVYISNEILPHPIYMLSLTYKKSKFVPLLGNIYIFSSKKDKNSNNKNILKCNFSKFLF